MGWKQNSHCFYKVELKNDIKKNTLMFQQKKLNNKKKLKYFKRFIIDPKNLDFIDDDLKVAIITPDKDIVPESNLLSQLT